jgi:S1-C subfamily serine protease
MVAALAGSTARAQAEKVYDKILKSAVWVVVPHPDKAVGGKVPFSMGTGTLIDAQKKIVLTNYHVVTEATEIIVFFPAYKDKKIIAERKHYLDMINNGGGIKAQTVARDKKVDLALVQLASVPEGTRVMPLARDSVSPGQSVHSVGNPGASLALWVYTPGKVRQVYQKQFKAGNDPSALLDIDARVIETDSPTNPGDSGGPLVNDNCELVGVTQGGARNAASISTFIDMSEVKTLLTKSRIRPVVASATPEKPSPAKKPEKPATPAKTESPEERAERLASVKLQRAKDFAEDGNKKDALKFCEDLLKDYPKTKAAEEAKVFIERLKKK